MKRAARTWPLFIAALALALGVMLFFTAKMLQLERSIADAQARAALEETIRLALWRMDSAAAILLAQDAPSKTLPGNRAEYLQQPAQQARNDLQSQTLISQQEYQQRQSLNVVALPTTAPEDWRDIEPALLDRIRDILPTASLAPANTDDDTRRLATIPARLLVPDSALPDARLPWNTPLRISLMVAWACVILAAAAVGRLLAATLSLSERRGAFASAVTHELRTPLTTFRMYSEMLASGVIADPDARRQYLQTLVTESDRLGHLIENVLAYSRLENRAAPRPVERLSLNQLIEQSLPTLQRRAAQANLALATKLPEDAGSITCQTDPVAVQQILLNLVDNACKYGGTDITLAAHATDTTIELSIADHGPGLPPAAAHRAFTAFNKSKSDAIPGIGLGLYLSRQLARNLGGELSHRPSTTGAMFVLSLPK